MTVVDTSTAETATAYSNQRKIDRCQNGVLWTMFWNGNNSTTSAMEFWYSTDDGETFVNPGTGSHVGFAGTGDSHFHSSSFFIDVDDYAHLVYEDAANGDLVYRRGTPNGGRTAWEWSPATVLFNSNYAYPDIVAHREGTGWVAHVVVSIATTTAVTETHYVKVNISSDGTVTTDSTLEIGGDYNPSATGRSPDTYPSIDFNHTGDGKTVAGGTPHLYAAWSAGRTGSGYGIRFRKVTYSDGSWAWGDEREIDSTRHVAGDSRWLNCMFDGTRVVIAGFLTTSTTSHHDLMLYDRDVADTATVERELVSDAASTVDAVFQGSATYDDAGNVYFVGRGEGGTDAIRTRKWARETSTLETSEVVDDTDISANSAYCSVKRGHSNSLVEFIYADGSAAPYSVTYGSVALNVAPNAPSSLSPDGGTIDKDITQRFSWTFSDPDAGDSQSAYDLRYRVQGTSTWTEVSGGATEYHDFAGGTFTADDWEWQVRTNDAAGEVGPWSASATFTGATTPAAPSISDPINGGTISTEDYTVEWSASSQDAYEVRRVADDGAGSPDTGTVYSTTGTVVSTGRSRTVTFGTNNRDEHVQVRVRSDGLWSSWASVQVTVSYTVPATPTLTATSDSPVPGAVRVQPSHPAPAGDEPTVTSVDLWRRETSDAGSEDRIVAGAAPSSPLDVYSSRSGVSYEFRLRAYGENGTSSWSAWTG